MLFYGICLGTCYFCTATLFIKGAKEKGRWCGPHDIHWVMRLVFLALFFISTFGVFIGYDRNYRAFVQSGRTEEKLLTLTNWINGARSITQIAILIIGNFLLTYRCWAVYGRRWLAVIPSTVLFICIIFISCRMVPVGVYASLKSNPEDPSRSGIPINGQTAPWRIHSVIHHYRRTECSHLCQYSGW